MIGFLSKRFFSAFQRISVEKIDRVEIIRLNRPKELNALSWLLIEELSGELKRIEEDLEIGAVVLTGNGKDFAVGADLEEMKLLTSLECYMKDFIVNLEKIDEFKKPIVAAVNGCALGGGCELAMMCDIILVGEKACFLQPEIQIANIPGAGGTERLVKAIGKSRAMEVLLTGEMIGAEEAVRRGLVSRVVEEDELVEEAVKVAEKVASFSLPVVMMAKEVVKFSFESGLKEGLLFERRMFEETFGLEDREEGMTAFVEKRKPNFKNR